MVGKGPEKNELQKLVDRLMLKNVHIMNSIPKKSVHNFLKLCDLLYIGMADAPLFQFGISPNKIFDYMMSARPLLLALSVKNQFEEINFGKIIPANDIDVVAEQVVALSKLEPDELDKFGKNGQEYAVKNHNYEILAKKFLDVFL
jgi:glycosyltransferase involved in cell wall biosynthesis